jgi:hypothetical protein
LSTSKGDISSSVSDWHGLRSGFSLAADNSYAIGETQQGWWSERDMKSQTLLVFLARQFIAPVVRKGFLSGEYVVFADYVTSSGALFEMGVVLGLAFRTKITIFAQLFSEPGREASCVAALAESAASRLAGLPAEPESVFDLFVKPETERVMKVLYNAGIARFTEFGDFPKVARCKLPLKKVFPQLQFAAAYGIAFGSHYPEMAERLLSYVENDEEWKKFYAAGLNIPPTPPLKPNIRDRQAQAFAVVRAYVQEVRPELKTAFEGEYGVQPSAS